MDDIKRKNAKMLEVLAVTGEGVCSDGKNELYSIGIPQRSVFRSVAGGSFDFPTRTESSTWTAMQPCGDG